MDELQEVELLNVIRRKLNQVLGRELEGWQVCYSR